MAKMKKWKLEKEYVEVPNKTAVAVETRKNNDDPESCLSLQALGLIVNLWSYNTEEWELHKTELYKRYGKNKETSVKNAWKELMDANYIIEYKFRVGKQWDYEYYYRIKPFTDEERKEILAYAEKEHGQIWGLDFQDLKMKTSKPRDNKKELKKDIIKEKEEEEIITNPVTESMILDLMNQKIIEREITNPKTIRAIHDVASKCKAIGTTDLVAAENYVIKVVEEKMSKLGQKQKVRQGKAKVSGAKAIRTEMTPDWLKEDTSSIVEDKTNRQASENLEEERKRLEKELKKYKRD
ncbi:hypothetical protein [Bacillus pseudomycoides]|uniref:hypothetical protein n=1 Tax=Bacillus pseudomycoides TaxID=64104 RepID=UPI000BF52FC0|nr:hypothetical protein [Bacillus pseudomycoides]PFW97682.1 hypothetical protein COL29_02555 [Bacillus pseudomycoides]